jgi:uncharacterized protein (TIGR02147 family)
MFDSSIAAVLEKRFEVKQSQNPLYSLRAFARDLGISSGQLSMILSKKRGVSVESADRMAKALKLNRVEKQYFLNLAVQEHGRSKRIQGIAKEKVDQIRHVKEALSLSQDQFSIISEWYHMAILQVMQLQNYAESAKAEGECLFISKRLNLTEETVLVAIARLLKLGAIISQGEYHQPASDFVMVAGSVPSSAVKRFHKQNIQKAVEALEYQESSSCAFKTTTLSIDSNDFKKINNELGDFCKNIMIKYGKTQSSAVKPNQVCILSQQFFKVAEVHHD